MSQVLTHREIIPRRPDCLAGAGGFERSHGGIKSRGFSVAVRPETISLFCEVVFPCPGRATVAFGIAWISSPIRFRDGKIETDAAWRRSSRSFRTIAPNPFTAGF